MSNWKKCNKTGYMYREVKPRIKQEVKEMFFKTFSLSENEKVKSRISSKHSFGGLI